MNHGNWNLNPMANYAGLPYEQTISVGRWNVPPYDDQFHNFYAAEPSYSNGVIFQSSRQCQSDEVEVVVQAPSRKQQRKREIELQQMDQRRTEFSWSSCGLKSTTI